MGKRFLCAAVLLLCTAATSSAQDVPLNKILVENEGWRLVAKDMPGVTLLSQFRGVADLYVFQGSGVTAAKVQPDGNIYRVKAAVDLSDRPHPWLFTPTEVVIDGSWHYKIEKEKTAIGVSKNSDLGVKQVSTTPIKGIANATCLTLWPRDEQLVIGDAAGKYLWTARIEKDGSLSGLDRYYSLRVKPEAKGSGVKAMVMDAGYLLYAVTPLGVQVFDPTGRLAGVILPPMREEMTAITIGGKDADTLFVACGDKVYSRKIQGKAAYTLKKDK